MSTLVEPVSPPRATPLAQPAVSRAFLLIDQPGKRQGGAIAGRVLIGRRDANHIVIPDRSVARIHAWITSGNGQHILHDTGNPAGTLVNDVPIAAPHTLQPGDVIRIGPATIHYGTDPAAIADAEPIDLSDRPVAPSRPGAGQFVDCACGAPLWVPANFTGKMGQCRYCGQTIVVHTKPVAPVARATPLAKPADPSPAPSARPVCGICQSPINEGEPDHACPSCAIPFHADCWTENRGCSSYGCTQVNILAHADESPYHPQSPPLRGGPTDPDPAPLPWEFLILAAAVVGSILGAWTFGLPALAAALAATLGLRKPSHHRAALYVALPFAAIGCLAGIAISYFWWFALRHAGAIHR